LIAGKLVFRGWVPDRAAQDVGKSAANRVAGKSADRKLAIAAELKRRSLVTNRWLTEAMQMDNPHEVSSKVADE
jgi:hypothetical protein